MKKNTANIKIFGIVGRCGSFDVFLGTAPANILNRLSFADILNEDTGEGYQRLYNRKHSLDFKKYITSINTSTVPLVFNLRQEFQKHWSIKKQSDNSAILEIAKDVKCFARIDCQHRIGELSDCSIPLAFMTYIGLDLRTEMAQFNIINSKAKGLSRSLTDYHESTLIDDLINTFPHLFIARKMNEDINSPWYKLVRYGGESTSGLKRRTSLRMLQKSVKEFLNKTSNIHLGNVNDKYDIICMYWKCIKTVFPDEWNDHRHHLLTKGIGLYAMMRILANLLTAKSRDFSEEYFLEQLYKLKGKINWHSNGTFSDAGGKKGVITVHAKLKEILKIL